MQVEIDQGEAGAQPVMVLRDPPVSHLVEAEDAFQDVEHMFYFRSYFRLSCVLSSRFFGYLPCYEQRLSCASRHEPRQLHANTEHPLHDRSVCKLRVPGAITPGGYSWISDDTDIGMLYPCGHV
jgi:hypothetical protein